MKYEAYTHIYYNPFLNRLYLALSYQGEEWGDELSTDYYIGVL